MCDYPIKDDAEGLCANDGSITKAKDSCEGVPVEECYLCTSWRMFTC